AIAQAVHLVESARLVARRHEEQVRAALDQMREGLVETAAEVDPVGMLRGQPGEEILIARLSGAEHDVARVELEQLGLGLLEEVEALLLGETRHDADDGPVGAGGKTA